MTKNNNNFNFNFFEIKKKIIVQEGIDNRLGWGTWNTSEGQVAKNQ